MCSEPAVMIRLVPHIGKILALQHSYWAQPHMRGEHQTGVVTIGLASLWARPLFMSSAHNTVGLLALGSVKLL